MELSELNQGLTLSGIGILITFSALGVISSELCAPFDRDRSGLNLGEGAGILILETLESARKRGAASSVHLLGYGLCADAHHLTAPVVHLLGASAPNFIKSK